MKKVVLIIAFMFIFLSISLTSAVPGYNSAKSNVIANKIHEDVSDDVDSLLKVSMHLGVAQGEDLDRKTEPREDAKKGLNAVNVKLARMIQVNVSSSVNLLKEVKKAEPREVAKKIHVNVSEVVNLLKEKEKEPRPTTAKEIHVNVLSIVGGINSPSSKGKVFRIGKAS